MKRDGEKLYNITKEGEQALKELAKKFNAKPNEVLDMLVKDRHSVSDSRRNSFRRRQAYEKFVGKMVEINKLIEDEKAPAWIRPDGFKRFTMAYNMGWEEFQLRHDNHPPILRVTEVKW
jgi:hypothetical protein